MISFIPEWQKHGGKPPDLWIGNQKFIAEFIKTNNLHFEESIDRDLPSKQAEFIGETHGGRRGPHLHYQGKTFLVDAKQWKEFSDKVVKEFVTKLERANAIPVQQMHELNSIISGLSMKA